LVAGKKRVPKPAAGKTAFLTLRAGAEFGDDCESFVVISFSASSTGRGLAAFLSHSRRVAIDLSIRA
jgi:hypothetical protein